MAAGRIGNDDKRSKIIWEWASGLAISNVYDEIYGDPTIMNLWEVLFAITITLCTLYRLKKCKINTLNT